MTMQSKPAQFACLIGFHTLFAAILTDYNLGVIPLVLGLLIFGLVLIEYDLIFFVGITSVAFYNIAIVHLGLLDLRPYQFVWSALFASLVLKAFINQENPFKWSPIILPLMLLIVTHITSIKSSGSPMITLKESIQIIYFGMIFLIIQQTIQSKEMVIKVVHVLLIVTSVFICWGLFVWMMHKPPVPGISINIEESVQIGFRSESGKKQRLALGSYIKRTSACFLGPVATANYLSMMLILILSMIFAKHVGIWKRTFLYLLFLAGYILLVTTYSRAGWIVFPACVILLMYLRKQVGLPYLFVLVSLFFVAIAWAPVRARFFEILHPSQEASAMGHLVLYIIGIKLFMSSPLLGIGAGLFPFSLSMPQNSPHNMFIEIAAETGIIGLMSLVWFIVALFVSMLKAIKLEPDGYYRDILIGLTLAVTSMILMNLTMNAFKVETFWVMLGLGYAASMVTIRGQEGINGVDSVHMQENLTEPHYERSHSERENLIGKHSALLRRR